MPSGIYVRTEKTKQSLRLARVGILHTEETKEKMRGKIPWMKGKKHTDEAKLKNREKHLGKTAWNKGINYLQVTGSKNCNWKGGISKKNKSERQLAMETLVYKNWRTAIFTRDNFSCVHCGKKGVKIQADHIKPWVDFPELRYNLNNGRTLCIPCHKEIGWNLFKNRNPKKLKVEA